MRATYSPASWPLDEYEVAERNELAAKLRRQAQLGLLGADDEGRPVVMTDEGVTPVRPREHPGGWAEFGYDDTADENERRGR